VSGERFVPFCRVSWEVVLSKDRIEGEKVSGESGRGGGGMRGNLYWFAEVLESFLSGPLVDMKEDLAEFAVFSFSVGAGDGNMMEGAEAE
jgi:hypothetical protein